AHDVIQIPVDENLQGESTLMIYDQYGSLACVQHFDARTTLTCEVQITNLPSGIYYVLMRDHKQTIAGRFVKT
ncbi:MAG TPA: hypothetical protein PKN15_03365, partial [Chitinophagales bacterium]|nr:hypothetical protein [Chitinophagales bacterium]